MHCAYKKQWRTLLLMWKRTLSMYSILNVGVISWCIYSTLCPLVFCCCQSLPCFPGNRHYLLLLSQCDHHRAKAAPLQHPQEMEIQCCVCVCVLSQRLFQMSSYLHAGEQRQSQRPLLHKRSFRRTRGGREGALPAPYMEGLEFPPFPPPMTG